MIHESPLPLTEGDIVRWAMRPDVPYRLVTLDVSYAVIEPARDAIGKEPRHVPRQAIAPWPVDLDDLP